MAQPQPWETFDFKVENYIDILNQCELDDKARMELFQLAQLKCGGQDAANDIIHKVKKSLQGARHCEQIRNYSAYVQSQCVEMRHKLMWWLWTPNLANMGYKGQGKGSDEQSSKRFRVS